MSRITFLQEQSMSLCVWLSGELGRTHSPAPHHSLLQAVLEGAAAGLALGIGATGNVSQMMQGGVGELWWWHWSCAWRWAAPGAAFQPPKAPPLSSALSSSAPAVMWQEKWPREDLTALHNHLKAGCVEVRVRLFSQTTRDSSREVQVGC